MRSPLAASIIGMTSFVYLVGLGVWIATLYVGRDNVQDIARSFSVSIAQQLKSSMLADLMTAETITRTNARIFRTGAWIHPDRDDPRGPEVEYFLQVMRQQLYGSKRVTTVCVTDYRGNLIGVYNNHDYTFAGRWDSYVDTTNGTRVGVLLDYETAGDGKPNEGTKLRLIGETRPYNSSEQIWYTVCDPSDPNSNAWTPLYNMGTIGVVTTMMSHSTIAFRPDGSLIGAVTIDMAIGFVNKLLVGLPKGVNAFAVDILEKDGALIGNSDPAVELIRCGVALVNGSCPEVGIFIRPADSESGLVRKIDAYIKGRFGSWQSSVPISDTIDGGFFELVAVERNKLSWRVAVSMPRSFMLGKMDDSTTTVIIVVVIAGVLTLAIAIAITFRIVAPLRLVAERLHLLSTLDIPPESENADHSYLEEIYNLQTSFDVLRNSMDSFSKYVPLEVVRTFTLSGSLNSLLMVPVKITLSFTDIEKFTNLCQHLDAATLVYLVTTYFDIMTKIVMTFDGVVDKFIGDCIMVLWGTPIAIESRNLRACAAALVMHCATQSSTLRNAFARAHSRLSVRTGIHSGECLAGNMGTGRRVNYTVIGDTVNLAARLEAMNKDFNTSILVSEDVVKSDEREMERFAFRLMGSVKAIGRDASTRVYELMGLRPLPGEEKSDDDVHDDDVHDDDVPPYLSAPNLSPSVPPINLAEAPLSFRSKNMADFVSEMDPIPTGDVVQRASTACGPVPSQLLRRAEQFTAAVERYVSREFDAALPLLCAMRDTGSDADRALVAMMIADCTGKRTGVFSGVHK